MERLDENVDEAEIRKFEAAASRWWSRRGDFRALHDINPLRVAYIEDRAGLMGKRVLDVGCGGGILSEAMARRGARVTGIDMGEGPLAIAKAHCESSGLQIDYRRATVERWADLYPHGFDVVVCMELLEHVPDPESVVQACGRLAKPGGDVFFATLNRTPKSFLLAILGAEYMLRLVRPGTHRYDRFIRPLELCNWSEKAGLVRLDVTGMRYNPFSGACTLSRRADVNYLAHFRSPGAV
jgi:2-polyprenyl-6-hydroxyphenyl methylase/3-demethylubiquinone-9 3-methyltransferase